MNGGDIMSKLNNDDLEVIINVKGSLNVPDDVLDTLARAYLPAIRKFYEDENNVKLFEEWKKEQDKLNQQE